MSSPDTGQYLVDLLSVMTRLRGEGGCPWDREQTRESLRGFLLEETYEVLDALDQSDPRRICEELGDLLFQIVFHAEIARERGEFEMASVMSGVTAKMIRRHPHVFGERKVSSAAEALAQWEALKQAEGGRRSVLDGLPRAMPALSRADRVQHRASRVGFDWPGPASALDKVREEAAEVEAALTGGTAADVGRELGDLLFAVVNVARLAGVDPDGALSTATERFSSRFHRMEAAARHGGRELRDMSMDEMDRLWAVVKSEEPSP